MMKREDLRGEGRMACVMDSDGGSDQMKGGSAEDGAAAMDCVAADPEVTNGGISHVTRK